MTADRRLSAVDDVADLAGIAVGGVDALGFLDQLAEVGPPAVSIGATRGSGQTVRAPTRRRAQPLRGGLVPGPVHRDEVQALVERGGAQLVEVLSKDAYDEEHLPKRSTCR